MIYQSEGKSGTNPLALLFFLMRADRLWLCEATLRLRRLALFGAVFYFLLGLFFYLQLLGILQTEMAGIALACAMALFASPIFFMVFRCEAYRVRIQSIEKVSVTLSAQVIAWVAFCVSMYFMQTYFASIAPVFAPFYPSALLFLALGFVPLAEYSFRVLRGS